MAVYVDKPEWEWRGKLWCHLLADSLDELHSFAKQLGMRRAWFQEPGHKNIRYPHYDLTASKHELALRLGAQLADRKTIIERARTLREEYFASRAQASLFPPP